MSAVPNQFKGYAQSLGDLDDPTGETQNLTKGTPRSEPQIDAGDMGTEKEHSYYYFRDLREKLQVTITQVRSLSFLDYVQTLELDTKMVNLIQKKKLGLSGFIYYFNMEIKDEKNAQKWELRRRFADFVEFDKNLNEELTKGSKMTKAAIPQLSKFYNTKAEGAPENFIEAAEKYITTLLKTPQVRSRSKVFYEFLEFSLLPLVNTPRKYKEGGLRKKGGGRFKHNKIKLYCSVFFTTWQQRWFILTEEGIIYTIDSDSTKAREMLLFDQSFQIEYGKDLTGNKVGITIITPNRRLELQTADIFEALDWIGEIQKAAKASPYTKINRFLSFAPNREANHYCKWFVDSDGYFGDLHDTLLQAKKEVFITDWWLSPEINLKGPVQDGESEYRLDKVLGKVANSGVKVYVIVYHEVKMVCYNDSEHTKKALEALSPNITVLRHPSEPFFSWSHHEKLVVIDQTIGFIGGFDLCFGRLDTSDHPLYDPAFAAGKGHTYLGKEYSNPRLVDFKNCREHDVSLIDKSTTPRMPFHDAMIKMVGPVIDDLSRHFIQYWNHVEVDVYGKEEEVPLPKTGGAVPIEEVQQTTTAHDNASLKFKSAFRKIFGMRMVMGGVHIQPMPGENTEANQTSAQQLGLKRAQSTLPPDQRLGEEEHRGSLRDGIKAIIAANKAQAQAQNDVIVEKHEEQPDKHATYDKNDPHTGNPGDTLLTGKTGEFKEMRAVDKAAEETKENKAIKVINQFKKRPLIMPSNRQVQTMNNLGYPQGPVKTKDDKDYRDKYANLLKGIREKEKSYETDLKMSQSQQKASLQNIGVFSKAGGKENPNLPSKFAPKVDPQKTLRKEMSDQFYEKNMLKLLFSPKDKAFEGSCHVQMVRSASKWSLGLNANDGNLENSIQNAYIELIQNSKRFIYIENQFFMSSTAGKTLKNDVAQALVYRIELAHERGERFRVIVYLPLLPAFEGDVVDSKAALLRLQLYWQFMTISRGGESVYEQLRDKGINPEEYIQFFGLRNHAKMMNEEPASELIYIHSKIMVVDDEILLIGSANINDRSLQGSRDSEIAMVIEDTKKVPSFMNGEAVEVNEFAHTFRKRLMGEHLGFTEQEVQDPMTDDFIYKMSDIAETNTNIYRDVFACYPDDQMRTLASIDEMKKTRSLEKYDELAPSIKGHTVWFPLDFLADENLRPPMTTMEYYLSDQTFT